MKKFKELTEGMNKKVPVYHEPDKLGEYPLVGHVHASATSVGAAKLAGKKSASLKRIDGKYGWVASDNLKESKYGDAMTSRLPSHLDDPRVEPTKKVVKKPVKRNPKDHSWKLYRESAALDAVLEELTPRERVSGAERLKPKKQPPVDQAEKQKQQLAKQDKVNDNIRKNLSASQQDKVDMKETTEVAFDESGEGRWDKGDRWGYTPKHGNTQHAQLHHHGWKRGAASIYTHPEHPGHAIAIGDPTGKFSHSKGTTHYHALSPDLTSHLEQFHQKALKESYDMAYEESGGYKVGDQVIPKIGPHQGTVHTVIHVHPTGHVNITPNTHVTRNRYQQGAARVHPLYLKHAAKLNEDVSEGYKVGDRVIPKIGPHKGEVHKVIHVHSTGHVNITPENSGYGRKNRYHLGAARAHPHDLDRAPMKEAFSLKTGVNRKTVQEVFQAAKDKMKKVDNLPDDGAKEPNKEVPGAPSPTATNDGGAPDAQKKNNRLKPENSGKSKKMDVKGPGPDDKFQPEPIVTPLTTMPDTASPKSGSQGVR